MDEEEWTEEDPSSENTPSDEASEGYEGLNELYGALDDQLECEVDEDYDAIRENDTYKPTSESGFQHPLDYPPVEALCDTSTENETLSGTKRCRDGHDRKQAFLEVAQQTCPPHPGYFGGMCVRCGSKRDSDEEGAADRPMEGPRPSDDASVALRYLHPELEVSAGYAHDQRRRTAHEAMQARKLFLVLDLDHTLLNSCKFSDIDPATEAQLDKILRRQSRNPSSAPTLYRLDTFKMYTKLRPGVFELFAALKDKFQFYVYTMGDKQYAHAMASLLDTSGALFKNRIVSNIDCTQKHQKDLDVVMLRGADDLVAILDDTEQVWARNLSNVIPVERYHFFPASAANFKLPGQSLCEREVDENVRSGQLANVSSMLLSVHATFFNNVDACKGAGRDALENGGPVKDVRTLLVQFKKALLADVVVLFSRVFPESESRPHLHPMWRLAESLGAKCASHLGPEVTHVVAAAPGTEKVRRAKERGLKVVSPRWLEATSILWKRMDEEHFAPKDAASDSKDPVPRPTNLIAQDFDTTDSELQPIVELVGDGKSKA